MYNVQRDFPTFRGKCQDQEYRGYFIPSFESSSSQMKMILSVECTGCEEVAEECQHQPSKMPLQRALHP
jgi:hypothetical protein